MDSIPSAAYLNETRQPQLWAAEITTRVLAWSAVILRLVARRVHRTPLWWDDYFIIVAILLLTVEFGAEIGLLLTGVGRHFEWVLLYQSDGIPAFLKLAYYDELDYAPVITLIKCSIISLYLRLFGVRRWFRRLCYGLIGVSVTWGLVTFFLFVFQCRKVSDAWAPGVHSDCFEFANLFLGTNIPNVIIDFCILSLPVYPVWALQMPATKKILVSAILAVGTAEVAISIVRVTILSSLAFVDPTWDDAEATIWSELEVNIGVICCCLPVLGPLLPKRFFDGIGSGGSSGKKAKLSDSITLRYVRQQDTVDEAQQPFAHDNMTSADGIRSTTDIHVVHHAADDKDHSDGDLMGENRRV